MLFREQLMFPFQFLDRLGKHDMICSVSGGGRAAQVGAIRLASARALCSFITENEVEFMRQGISRNKKVILATIITSITCLQYVCWHFERKPLKIFFFFT